MANPLRGEADLTIGGVTLTLAATLDGLAQLSAATGHPTMQELFSRLIGVELSTAVAVLRTLSVRARSVDGKDLPLGAAVRDAVAGLTMADITRSVQPAFMAMIEPLIDRRPAAETPDPNG